MAEPRRRARSRLLAGGVALFLLVEFLDELVYGALEAAWPLIRTDLGLNYLQIGLLVGLPGILASCIEPVLGLLADAGHRRRIVLAGGVLFVGAFALTAVAWGLPALFLAMLLGAPASGAFVGLAQASLMDASADGHERGMARWVAAGSVGVVAGPLVLAGGVALGLGWRGVFLAVAGIGAMVVLATRRLPLTVAEDAPALREVARGAVRALRRTEVLRWLTILELADLLGDVFFSLLALYFVDVVGVSPGRAALAVAVWSGAGLVGDVLLVPLLARVDGLRHLRATAVALLAVYSAFLLADGLGTKLALVALLGLLHAGWYAIPQGRLYAALPGASGTAVALSSVAGVAGGMIPLALGGLAQALGLAATMWVLLLAPVAVLAGLPGGPFRWRGEGAPSRMRGPGNRT